MKAGSGVTIQHNFSLRWAKSLDYTALADVMFEAVRTGPSRYTEAQREQWVPARRIGADWTARLDRQAIIVAEDSAGIVAFMTLADAGYIDFAYILPESQGKGLFRRLYAEIEKLSHARRDPRLWVHASLAAMPAFAALGFSITEKQIVTIGTEKLERFEMKLFR